MKGPILESTTAQQNAVAIAVIETEMKHLKTGVEELSADIKAIRSQLDQAKGGWRVLVLIGGAAGALGAGLQSLLSHWKP